MPYIGQDFTVDVFQLIQIRHTLTFRVQFDRARHGERNWIDVANLVRAVAHDQRLVVVGEAPAFGVVRKFPDLPEGAKVINEPFFRQPRKLIDLAVKNCQSLAEVFRGKTDFLDDLSSVKRNLTQSRLASDPSAFVEISTEILQSLGEGVRVMGIGAD